MIEMESKQKMWSMLDGFALMLMQWVQSCHLFRSWLLLWCELFPFLSSSSLRRFLRSCLPAERTASERQTWRLNDEHRQTNKQKKLVRFYWFFFCWKLCEILKSQLMSHDRFRKRNEMTEGYKWIRGTHSNHHQRQSRMNLFGGITMISWRNIVSDVRNGFSREFDYDFCTILLKLIWDHNQHC